MKLALKKDLPYIKDLTFTKYDFEKGGEQIKEYSIFEIKRIFGNIYIYIYIEMGLSESSLNIITKHFPFLSHCKVSCDSPSCIKICGEGNHCIFNTDTHENVISDEEEQIEKQ